MKNSSKSIEKMNTSVGKKGHKQKMGRNYHLQAIKM